MQRRPATGDANAARRRRGHVKSLQRTMARGAIPAPMVWTRTPDERRWRQVS
jgi:hypothetical protein